MTLKKCPNSDKSEAKSRWQEIHIDKNIDRHIETQKDILTYWPQRRSEMKILTTQCFLKLQKLKKIITLQPQHRTFLNSDPFLCSFIVKHNHVNLSSKRVGLVQCYHQLPCECDTLFFWDVMKRWGTPKFNVNIKENLKS